MLVIFVLSVPLQQPIYYYSVCLRAPTVGGFAPHITKNILPWSETRWSVFKLLRWALVRSLLSTWFRCWRSLIEWLKEDLQNHQRIKSVAWRSKVASQQRVPPRHGFLRENILIWLNYCLYLYWLCSLWQLYGVVIGAFFDTAHWLERKHYLTFRMPTLSPSSYGRNLRYSRDERYLGDSKLLNQIPSAKFDATNEIYRF